MRTRTLTFFTDYDTVEEYGRLINEEKALSLALARRSEVPPEERPKTRMSEKPEDLKGKLAKVRADLEDARAAVEESMVCLTMTGLNRKEFRRLMVEHPPRDDDHLDLQVGYNGDTFPDALIQRCIVRVDNNSGEPIDNEWDRWADEMPQGDWEEIFSKTMALSTARSPQTLPQ